MYNHVDSNHALILQWRYALGGNQTVRYPDDRFDRIWTPADGILLSEVESEASSIDISTAEDHPPETALKNAITSSITRQYMQFINRLPTEELPIYITAYFSEVMESAIGKRSIQIYIDDKPFSSPIIPPYRSVKEVYITNMTASANTSFVLRASDSSTLPPILNALEVYTISDALTAGTDNRDVEGLFQLQLAFEVLLEWNGDPCLPYPFNWDWIECTNDVKPRVIALHLNGYNLRGTLPDFSSLNALETIDLHNNTIGGAIPDFLGLLPNLKILNLSYNRFNGSIPTSLKNKNIKLDTTNNCLSGMKCQPLNDSLNVSPPLPPPPQLFSGDKPDSPSELHSGDEPVGDGSVKISDLNIAFIVAMQTLLPLLFMKFV